MKPRALTPAGVFSERNLLDAWKHVRRHSTAAGVDGFSPEDFERNDAEWLRSVRKALLAEDYRFSPLRLHGIPKRDGGMRWIGIPTVRDRIVGRALCLELTDRVDRRLHPSSYAYRPNRGVRDAVRNVRPAAGEQVARFDIESCFDTICPELAVASLGAVEPWVRDTVLEAVTVPLGRGGDFRRGDGIPQGSALSPLLCNCVLDGLDRALSSMTPGYVRYADDMTACCASRGIAQDAMDRADRILGRIGMRLNAAKCSVTSFGEGFKYLGTWFQGTFAFPQLEVVMPSGRRVRVSGYEGDSGYAVIDWGEGRRGARWA